MRKWVPPSPLCHPDSCPGARTAVAGSSRAHGHSEWTRRGPHRHYSSGRKLLEISGREENLCGTNENVKQGSRVIVVGFSIYLTYVFIIRWVYIRVSLWILLDLSYILLIKDNNVQLISVPVQESFLADYPFRQSHVESPSFIDKKSITHWNIVSMNCNTRITCNLNLFTNIQSRNSQELGWGGIWEYLNTSLVLYPLWICEYSYGI